MIVVDASVLVTALGDDGDDGRRARDRLNGERLTAPELVDLEVTSVFRRLCAAQQFDPARANQALEDLDALRLDRVPHRPLIRRCWELRHNVTVYDAVYIALAQILGATLVTADQRLANASGSTCDIEVLR
jgi:predicted nucleic acid-binding protein